jgi:hypothetical protein
MGVTTRPTTRRCLVLSQQWAVVPCRGCEAPRAWIFGGELTAWVPVLLSFTWSILFLPGCVYLMSEASRRLGTYPWSIYYVRQWWDRFSTWVRVVRCAWASVATSHHDRRLRPPIPEALGLAMLIRYWKPPSVFDRRPGSCLRLREAGRVNRWWIPAYPRPS